MEKRILPKDVKLKSLVQLLNQSLRFMKFTKKTKDLNAFDFGDLILFCVKLEEHEDIRDIREKISNIF